MKYNVPVTVDGSDAEKLLQGVSARTPTARRAALARKITEIVRASLTCAPDADVKPTAKTKKSKSKEE